MDALPAGVQRSQEEVAGYDLPFRFFPESQMLCLFCHNLELYGCGDGCYAAVVGPHASICLPSVRHGKTGFVQAEIVRKLDSDLNRSSVDTEGVVSRFGRTSDRASSFPSGSLGPPVSVACQEVPPLPIKASSSCVETLKRFAKAAGFLSDVARRLARSGRSSFLKVYQSKWALYRRWCSIKDIQFRSLPSRR